MRVQRSMVRRLHPHQLVWQQQAELDRLLSLGMLQLEQPTTPSTTVQTTPHLQLSLLLSQEPAIPTLAYPPPQPTIITSRQNTAGASGESNRANATTTAPPGFTISSTTATVRESGVRGDMLWMESIDEYHELRVNTVDSEMNVISAGDVWSSVAATNPVDGTQDMYIVKHGPSGELIWQRQLGAVGSDVPNDVAVDSNDNIYVFGYTLAYDGVDFSGETISKSCGSPCSNALWLLIKYDKDGNRQWIKQIDKTGTSASSQGHARAMDIEGNAIYLAGWSVADGVNQVEKYDLDGNLQATINLTQPTDSSFTTSQNLGLMI